LSGAGVFFVGFLSAIDGLPFLKTSPRLEEGNYSSDIGLIGWSFRKSRGNRQKTEESPVILIMGDDSSQSFFEIVELLFESLDLFPQALVGWTHE
jgi:hypothetical protein